MGQVLQRAGGGLTRADMAKLVPENIRQGVTLFEGTAKEVIGEVIPQKIYIPSIAYTAENGKGDTMTVTLSVAGYKHLHFEYQATGGSYNYAGYYIDDEYISLRTQQSGVLSAIIDRDISGVQTIGFHMRYYRGEFANILIA